MNSLLELAERRIEIAFAKHLSDELLPTVDQIEQQAAATGTSRSGMREGSVLETFLAELRWRGAFAWTTWEELRRHADCPLGLHEFASRLEHYLASDGKSQDLWVLWQQRLRLPDSSERFENL